MRLLALCVLLASALRVEARCDDSDSEYCIDDSGSSSSGSSTYEDFSSDHYLPLSSPEECARECRSGDKPRTCHYKFIVEYYATLTEACKLCQSNETVRVTDGCQCILADGFEKSGIITVNRMYPGPSIVVCLHDYVVVDVENRVAGNEITIHWHGIFQKGYQYADGVPYVTQCPINENAKFRYQFRVNNPGTHFWHSHSGLQKGEGLMGPLIVREPKDEEPNNELWDVEDLQHTIYVSDWFHGSSADHYPGNMVRNPRQWPDSYLINGMGQFTPRNQSTPTTSTPLAVFTVKKGIRYRFRLINACGLACPVTMTIQNHKVTVIATDGESFDPVDVTSLSTAAAERYDFVLNADQEPATYWMQFRGVGECEELKIQQLAYLRYESSKDQPLIGSPDYDVGLTRGLILNEYNQHCDGDTGRTDVLCFNQLRSTVVDNPEVLRAKPDIQIYMGFGFYDFKKEYIFTPKLYKTFLVAINETVAFVGNITNVFPSSPLLSQREDIPDERICSISNLPKNCRGPDPCVCTHVEEVPLNSVVELILLDEGPIPNVSHPFHLHGHTFYVVGGGSPQKYGVNALTLPMVRDLDVRGLIQRELKSPPAKDTYAIPNTGFVIIRFYANNPGYWLFHCHFEFHLAVGMVTTFRVGKERDLRKPPRCFPKCGNYMPRIRDEV